MEGLTIRKDATLVETYWNYDEDKKEGSYLTREVERISPSILHDKCCNLEEGTTLRNIFEFLNKDINFWMAMVENWCDEIVKEGLKEGISDINDIKYLELCWEGGSEKYEDGESPICNSGYRMGFHGKSSEDNPDGSSVAISFIPVNSLSNLPVKINENYIFTVSTFEEEYKEKSIPLGLQSPSLFQVIYSIIWELSYHGGPEKRDATYSKLQETIKELKESYPDNFDI